MRFATLVPAVLLAAAAGASGQIVNGNFDTGFVALGGSGTSPAPWTSTAPGNSSVAFDTWDDTGANGLVPTFAAVFPGVTAQSGSRWAGGWDYENMSEPMAFTLTPGQQYTVSAWVHAPNPNIFTAGGWQFGLGANQFATPVTVALFPATVTWNMGWVLQSATFTAPSNAGALPYFFPQVYSSSPAASSYMGIDGVDIRPTPTPGTTALLGLSGLIFSRRRR